VWPDGVAVDAMSRRILLYLYSAAVVAATTGFGWLFFGMAHPTDVVLTYLLGVVVVAMRLGYGPSLFVAVASVAAYDFFFVLPPFSFAVYDARDFVTLGVMLFVAFVISNLTERLRREAASAAQRADDAKHAHLRAETEQIRNALLTSVSHDLRAPLAVVQGAATALVDQDGALPVDRRVELLRTISREAQRLNRLVTNLVDATALEAGAVRPRREWHSIEETIGVALTSLEETLGDRPVETDISHDVSLFAFDGALMEQVLVNLIENATKHTPPQSPITVAAHRTGEGLEVVVADRGAGIRRGEEERIFDKFYRATQAQPGMGLGLTICRGIALAHGGTIRAENRPGGGALFRILLPESDPSSQCRSPPIE
jgi:two-component system, OmpR family, sensor histidine kinase KdpD